MAELSQTANVHDTPAIEALQASLLTLQQVIDNQPQAIGWIDCDGIFLGCNRTFAAAVGLVAPSDVIGQSVDTLQWADYPLDFLLRGDRVLDVAAPSTNHTTIALGPIDDPTLWLDVHQTPLYDAIGGIIGMMATITDITAQPPTALTPPQTVPTPVADTPAELALRQNEERLRLVLESIPVMMDAFDENGLIIMWNSECERVTGYSAAEIIGNPKALEILYPDPEYRTQMLVEWAKLGNNFRNWEWQIGCKDGSFKTILWSNLSEQFPIPGWAGWGIGIDISDRKQIENERQRAEAQLRQSQELLQLVINTIPQAIVWKDRELTYLGCNQTFAHTVGLEQPDAVIGKTDDELPWQPQESAFYRQHDELVMATDTPLYHRIEPQRQADGKLIWCDTNKIPLHDTDGNVVGILGTFEDITERQQAEEALRRSEQQLRQQAEALEQTLKELKQTQAQMIQSEKMSSLGQLVAGVAHEINNPVNFIYGNLNYATDYIQDLLSLIQLYQQHYPNPVAAIQAQANLIDLDFLLADLPKLLSSMRLGADRIRQIVLSLRNFSRMDEAEMKTVDIHDGIDSTLMILQSRLKANSYHPGIEITRDYGDTTPVDCYPGQLNQVFMNILANAIDALEESCVDGQWSARHRSDMHDRPTIRIRTEQLPDRHIHITIADNGPGIAPTQLQRLFDPFFTTKSVGKGTGLGLSISYQIIVEKHKGQLWCVSAAGQGATFHIKIPIQQ